MSILRDVVCSVAHPITRVLTEIICQTPGTGSASGDRLMLENGNGFLLLETGDFLLLE